MFWPKGKKNLRYLAIRIGVEEAEMMNPVKVFRKGKENTFNWPPGFFWVLVLLSGYLSTLLVQNAQAAAPVVVGKGPGTEYNPMVAVNTDNNEALVAWFDISNSSQFPVGFYNQVYGRRLDASGNPLGNPFLLTQNSKQYPSLGGSRPSVIFNPRRHEYFVIYDRDYSGSTNPGIFAQRVSVFGLPVGNEITISPGTGQKDVRIAYDPEFQRYFAVWTSGQSLVGMFLTNMGVPIGTGAVLIQTGATQPALVFNPVNATYYLAYVLNNGTGYQVNGALLSRDALPLSLITLSSTVSRLAFPAITVNPLSNNFLAVWLDSREALPIPSIYGQLLNSRGLFLGATVRIASSVLVPSVQYSKASQNYLVTYQKGNPDASDYQFIKGMLFNSNLARVGQEFAISAEAAAGRAATGMNPNSRTAEVVWAGLNTASKSAILGKQVQLQVPAPFMSFTMTGEPNPVITGQLVTYTLNIVNQGTARANNTIVQDNAPGRIRFLEASTSQGSCSMAATQVRCKLGNLQASASATVTLTAMTLKPGQLVNRATLRWNSGGQVSSLGAKVSTKVR